MVVLVGQGGYCSNVSSSGFVRRVVPMAEPKALYAAPMPVSVHDVAAELRRRHPGLPTVKLHKLLYYCQGHHLATFGVSLFTESISAWDMGPVVGSLRYAERSGHPLDRATSLDEAGLNTIGYVLSRYGGLSGRDLYHLTHSEAPWRLADAGRTPGTSVRIPTSAIESYFRSTAGPDEDEEIVLDAGAVAEWLKDAARTRDVASQPDKPEELTARLNDLRSRVAKGA
jgi:uncharacterized phage-associated protein